MSLLTLLVILWGALTIVLVGLFIHKTILGFREDDQIFLDRAEAALEKEQLETMQRISRLETIIKNLAIVSGALLLLIAGVWVYLGLYSPTLIY